ncbi:MAG: hypothetical protein HYY98_17085 [Burkholderiales bacterium]|nr:hypothetical protein [Burkholderiales bacterium]
MYYIERNTITDAMFLAGSVGEPATGESAWAAGTYAVGAEVIRPTTHRVYRCAVARAPTDTLPPELDATAWADMRPTARYLPFGPQVRTDGKLVYQNYPLKTTTANIEYRLAQRYANAVAIFGAKGATWRVQVYDAPGGTLVHERSGRIKSAARSYWDYAYGQRTTTDRVLVTGLPIYPNAEVRISIEGAGAQLRAVSQIEVGKLRYLPGVDLGGVLTGVSRSPKVFTSRKTDDNGSTSVLIYGTSYDMSGTVWLSGQQEDSALIQLRSLLGRGVAYAPTLVPGFQQSLVFGVLKSSDVSRDTFVQSSVQFQIEGLPT